MHKKDKLYAVHMDGVLGCLLDSISKTKIDVIEGFTPPPLGDLPLDKARAAWKDRYTIWLNFPGPVFLLGRDEVRKCAVELLKDAAPGDNFVMGVCEDVPLDVLAMGLRTITDVVMEYGKYPIGNLG